MWCHNTHNTHTTPENRHIFLSPPTHTPPPPPHRPGHRGGLGELRQRPRGPRLWGRGPPRAALRRRPRRSRRPQGPARPLLASERLIYFQISIRPFVLIVLIGLFRFTHTHHSVQMCGVCFPMQRDSLTVENKTHNTCAHFQMTILCSSQGGLLFAAPPRH